jgi:hypothetical protein
MVFLASAFLPLWAALLVWTIITAFRHAPRQAMVLRIITAPDGTTTMVTVPASEPVATTLARLHIA